MIRNLLVLSIGFSVFASCARPTTTQSKVSSPQLQEMKKFLESKGFDSSKVGAVAAKDSFRAASVTTYSAYQCHVWARRKIDSANGVYDNDYTADLPVPFTSPVGVEPSIVTIQQASLPFYNYEGIDWYSDDGFFTKDVWYFMYCNVPGTYEYLNVTGSTSDATFNAFKYAVANPYTVETALFTINNIDGETTTITPSINSDSEVITLTPSTNDGSTADTATTVVVPATNPSISSNEQQQSTVEIVPSTTPSISSNEQQQSTVEVTPSISDSSTVDQTSSTTAQTTTSGTSTDSNLQDNQTTQTSSTTTQNATSGTSTDSNLQDNQTTQTSSTTTQTTTNQSAPASSAQNNQTTQNQLNLLR